MIKVGQTFAQLFNRLTDDDQLFAKSFETGILQKVFDPVERHLITPRKTHSNSELTTGRNICFWLADALFWNSFLKKVVNEKKRSQKHCCDKRTKRNTNNWRRFELFVFWILEIFVVDYNYVKKSGERWGRERDADHTWECFTLAWDASVLSSDDFPCDFHVLLGVWTRISLKSDIRLSFRIPSNRGGCGRSINILSASALTETDSCSRKHKSNWATLEGERSEFQACFDFQEEIGFHDSGVHCSFGMLVRYKLPVYSPGSVSLNT